MYRAFTPVDVGVVKLEPGETKDDIRGAQRANSKGDAFGVVTYTHKEVDLLPDGAALVEGAIDVVNRDGAVEAACWKAAGANEGIVDELSRCTTVKEGTTGVTLCTVGRLEEERQSECVGEASGADVVDKVRVRREDRHWFWFSNVRW